MRRAAWLIAALAVALVVGVRHRTVASEIRWRTHGPTVGSSLLDRLRDGGAL